MIFALEGPDRCGKSTLFRALRHSGIFARFIERTPIPPDANMTHIETCQEFLFRQLYDPRQLYISDRSFCVSAEVYSMLHNRPMLIDIQRWIPEIHVVYLSVPVSELSRRNDADPDGFDPRLYVKCVNCYHHVLQKYAATWIEGCKPTSILVEKIREILGEIPQKI